MKTKLALTLLLALAALLTACGKPTQPPATATTETGMPNPASVYCEDQGGTLEIRNEAGGQVGYCKFADGSECEEWAFMRGECAPATAVQTPAAGGLQPLDSATCEEIRSAAAQALGVEATAANAPFQDPISGKSGNACQVTLTGTGANFQNPDAVVESLKAALEPQGWTEDMMYAAGGPTGIGTGMRQDTQLCMLVAGWTPSEDANCPSDKPISECSLTPEQHLYTITLTCVQEQ